MSDRFESSTVRFNNERIGIEHEIVDGVLEVYADESVHVIVESDDDDLRGWSTEFSAADADALADRLQRAAKRVRNGNGGEVDTES